MAAETWQVATMGTSYVEIRYMPQVRWAALRELRGCDQQLVRDVDTATAIRLLDSLLVDAPGASLQPGMAVRLAAADRDRLLAQVYSDNYSARIGGVIVCAACAERFEIDFDLAGMCAAMVAQAQPHGEAGGHYTYRLEDGRVIRLPTGEDELAVWRMAPAAAADELLRRCVLEGDWSVAAPAVAGALQAIAPLLDTELDARCPECGSANVIAFNIQHFLLAAIAGEERQLRQDVHTIAATYGWELATILDLPRSERRAYVELIVGDAFRREQRVHAL